MSIDDHIQKTTHPSRELQSILAKRLWDEPPQRLFNGEDVTELDLTSYFVYYTDQCNQALHDGGRSTSVNCHRDILEVVDCLKNGVLPDVLRQTVPCVDCDNNITKKEGSINLAARLLLMMNFGKYRYAICHRKGLEWEGVSMRDFLFKHFSDTSMLSSERIRLEKTFHAQSLYRVGGVDIIPTNNLTDHLRLSTDDKAVEIFHHVSFLEYQRNKYVRAIHISELWLRRIYGRSMFPDGLIDETLRTIALLFPQSERPVQNWFQSFCSSQETTIDLRLLKCGQLRSDDRQMKNFRFWHDRLVILKQVYDEAEPGNISQWWYDRRNGVQWYTFWVAVLVLVLTIVFGLVQSVEGALQVYKAYHPNN